jgi:hypothetical protein
MLGYCGTNSAQWSAEKKDDYMKLVNMFSVLSLLVLVTACGSSQPVTGAAGNAAYSPYGLNNTYPQNGSYGSLLIGGTRQVDVMQTGPVLQVSAYVNAGDRINVNLAGITHSVQAATCGSQWYNTVTVYNPPAGAMPRPLTNVTVTLNGQAITGSTVASAAGTVILTATLDGAIFGINCSALYNNQVAVPRIYTVNLNNAVTR